MIDYEDDTAFVNYINENYGKDRVLTKDEVIEVCEIVIVRTQIIYNKNYQGNTIHLPSSPTSGEVYIENEKTIHYEKLTDRDYYLTLRKNEKPVGSIAIVIRPK